MDLDNNLNILPRSVHWFNQTKPAIRERRNFMLNGQKLSGDSTTGDDSMLQEQ